MSRSDCKPLADAFDFTALRKSVLLPSGVQDASLKTEGPYAYRDLDECLELIEGYVEEVARFGVAARRVRGTDETDSHGDGDRVRRGRSCVFRSAGWTFLPDRFHDL